MPNVKTPALDPAALKAAVSAVEGLLNRPLVSAEDVGKVYRDHFNDSAFQTPKVKSRPQFSDDVYPPMPAAYLGEDLAASGVPVWTSPKDLLKVAASDSSILARILAAYIWKRGELGRVRYVREGILAALPAAADSGAGPGQEVAAENEDAPAVMWQFGRHLADSFDNPICDQHTYRAYMILEKGYRQSNPPKLLQRHINEYKKWWKEKICPKLLNAKSSDRQTAVYALDKLLFSLGKAARLFPAEFRRVRPSKKR